MDVQTLDTKLGQVATRQAGAFTWKQARESGFSPDQIKRRLETGQWLVLYPHVYRAATTKRTRELIAVAGLLYGGPKATFSHFTAARLWRIDASLRSESTWITVPHNRQIRGHADLVVKRTRAMPAREHIFDYPVSSVARTVVDLASILKPNQLAGVVHDVLRREATSLEQILGVADALRGRRGTASLRRVLEEYDPVFESMIEQEAYDHFAAAGLLLEKQVEIYDGGWFVARADFADRERKLAIMIDGFRWHSTRKAINRDRQQERMLARLGWTVLRFTTDDVRRLPSRMVQEVRAHLMRLAA